MLLCFCFNSDKHRPGKQRLPLSWVSHGPIWGTEESTLGNSICCNSSVPAGPYRAVSWPQQLALWVWQTRVSVLFPSLPSCAHSSLLFSLSTALGVQQPSLLGASPSVYSQQSALAAVSLSNQSAANYQLSQQTAALQQQAAAAAAAALQQVSRQGSPNTLRNLCILPWAHVPFSVTYCFSLVLVIYI